MKFNFDKKAASSADEFWAKIDQDNIDKLAAALGVDKSVIKRNGEQYGLPCYSVGEEQWPPEYIVAQDEDEVFNACKEEIESLMDDVGILDALNWNNMGGIEKYLSNPDFFEEAFRDSYQHYVQDIADEDGGKRLKEEMAEAGVDTPEELVEHLVESIDDYAEEFEFQFGKETMSAAIKEGNVSLDMDAVTQECIDTDGAGHLLSGYDGQEIELADGYTAYRVN